MIARPSAAPKAEPNHNARGLDCICGLLSASPDKAHDHIRDVWLDYARGLIAGLTFQLAADLVHTTAAPTWDDIGRVAAIAITRTFLSYFTGT